MARTFHVAPALLALLLAGCSPAPETAQEAAPAVAEAAPEASPEAETVAEQDAPSQQAFVLAVSDLDAYEKGLARETELRAEIMERAKAADEKGEASDTGEIVQLLADLSPEAMDPQAAEAAGVSVARYRALKDALHDLIGAEQLRELTLKPYETMDMSALTEEQQAQVARQRAELEKALARPMEALPPEVAEAYQDRRERLATVWAEYMAGLLDAGR